MFFSFRFDKAAKLYASAWAKLRKLAADDSGVAGVILASLIAIVAFSALSVFLNSYIGNRGFERAKNAMAGSGNVLPAVMAYYYRQSPNYTIPCPDTNVPPDGTADTCAGPGTTTGVLPWVTLSLSRDAVIDSYGNFYTYIVSTVGKNICSTLTTDLAGSTPVTSYTGALIDPTDLALVDLTGASRNVAFAIIGHGANGLGATKSGGAQATSPTSTREVANAAAAPSTIYSGPYSTDTSSYFDDQVFAPTNAELRKACETLTPGGALNADIADNFDSNAAAIDTAKFDYVGVTKVTDAASAANKVANFADNTAYLSTDGTAYNFTPTVRSVYTAAYWTPNVGAARSHAGISIATRATLAEKTSATSDDFSLTSQRGLTFRFYQPVATNISGGAGTANTISIRNNGAEVVNSAADTYQLINGKTYYIEVYDNGSDIWMRITQRDDVTNTATLRTTNATDLTGDQRVMYINDIGVTGGASVSYIDEVLIGLPMLALETGPTTGSAATANENNDNGTATGNLSLEAWIRPKSLTGTGAIATIMSKWDKNSTDTSAFRLFLNGNNNGQLAFSLDDALGSNDFESYDLGFKPNVNEWTHIAVTYDAATKVIKFYVDGSLASNITSGLDLSGIRVASQEFIVGAEQNGDVPVDFFHGYISDVRVWNDVRTAAEIEANFSKRLTAAGSEANLVVNWIFDKESGTVGGTQNVRAVPVATAIAGTLTGSATYSPILAVYSRPVSTSFCPAGTIAGVYQCDFRTASASGSTSNFTIPSNLTAVYAKVWGAGGGGYDATTAANETGGGSGGFSEGLIQSINGTSVAGLTVNVYAGGYGTGGTANDKAGGGGAGSGIFTALGNAGLVAGGGGGATYSARNVTGTGNCSGLTGVTRCGLGGTGGGAGALTTRAPDQLTAASRCGGRGGDNTPTGANPPFATDCDDGGGDPSGRVGGGSTVLVAPTGGFGGNGGGPAFIAGGRGYDTIEADGAPNANATGGGGGAAGGEAGGYFDNAATAGFGGGGGSGTADAGVATASGATGTLTATFSDATRTGARTSSSAIITIAAGISGAGWQAGARITGTGIPANTMILSIDSNTQITMTANASATGSSVVTVTKIPGSFPGGNTDFYYSPTTLATTLRTPGLGGTVGTMVNGRGGAVVLIW